MADLKTGVWFFPEWPASQLVDACRLAEDLGLDTVWVGDEGPAREPFSVLAAAARATERIELAVGITNPYVRSPALAASTMLTVHELSGGRALLGIGAGGQWCLDPYGLTATRPVAAVRDAIEVTRAVAAGRATEGYTPSASALTDGGVPLPIFVGARAERLNRLASEVADGVFVAGLPMFAYERVIGWSQSVRPIEVALYPTVVFTSNGLSEAARSRHIFRLRDSPSWVREELSVDLATVDAAAEALVAGDPGPTLEIVTDEVVGRLMLVGRPEEVGEGLADLVRKHRPQGIGFALLQNDLEEGIESSAQAFEAMHRSLASVEK